MASTLWADSTAIPPLVLKNYGLEDGLSSNYVVDITQDRKGYIWIATEWGLNRFDGTDFISFNKNNSALPGNELNVVLADPNDDKVWIGTQRNGFCYYDYQTGEIHTFGADDKFLSQDVTDLALATGGGVWVTHYHLGIDHFDPQTNTITPYANADIPGLDGRHWTATDDGNGILYVGHHMLGFSAVSLGSKTAVNYQHDPNDPNSLPGNEVRAICVDRNNNVWVGTDKGLALFHPTSGRFTSFKHIEGNSKSLLADDVRSIKQMSDGTLWIATNMGGVSILDLRDNAFTSPNDIEFRNITATGMGERLASPNARSLLQDAFGNIWIANYRGGIDVLPNEPPLFATLPYFMKVDGEIISRQVWSLCVVGDRIWMGSIGEIVAMEHGRVAKTVSLPNDVKNSRAHVTHIFRDSQGYLWLGTYNKGIYRYDERTNQLTQIGKALSEAFVWFFSEDSHGTIWIGTDEGIFTYANGVVTNEEQLNQHLPDIMIHSLLHDSDGKLWVCSFGKGLMVFDANHNLIHNFTTDNGFPSNAVNTMFFDSKQRVLVGTREGIVVFPDPTHPERFTTYGANEGLENNSVRAIQEDLAGRIWASTNSGIAYLDEGQGRFLCYNYREGIPLGDFMDNGACRDGDGVLYFASQQGACYFKPDMVLAERKVKPVQITQFNLYSRQTGSETSLQSLPINMGKIVLKHDQNTFNITFNVLDCAQSAQVEYRYKLEGLEEVWYETHGENQVTFRNLPPGRYILRVQSRFHNQAWSDHVEKLIIVIKHPWWLTWWAKLFYLVVVLVALLGALNLYKRKLVLESSLEVERQNSHNEQRLNNERLRFYTNITHELRTPLTLILGPLEDLLTDTSLSPKHANKISLIHDSATRLLNLINGILEFRKTETQNRKLSVQKGDLAALVQEIGLRYKELNPNNKVTYHICIETDETELFFDAETITTILNNLLSNAAKYTAEGSITLSLRSVQEQQVKYTEIAVADTGHGIDAEAMPHIFDRYYQAKSKYQVAGSGIGLALVKSLAELHQGILNVVSQVDQGTTFTLRLLTENTYPNAQHKASVVANAEEEAKPQGESKQIILVVEDNDDVRNYIKSSFDEHCEVITANDGAAGWEMAKNKIPNVIISDIMMPVMDGIELCQKVKNDMRTSHIPVILLTAKDSIEDKAVGYASGADSYISKPFSARLLHSRINNLLEARRRIAQQIAATDMRAKQEATEVTTLNELDNEFLQKLTKVIEDNLAMDRMDVPFLADKMCMSHSTLYRKIKGLTEMSANEFIRKVKMRKSIELLQAGRYSISDIAYMTGFSSVAYFRQCFKEEFGMSPTEFKNS